jgi:hypothetical protein
MTYNEPVRTATLQPHYGTTTRYGRHRRRVPLSVVVALVLALLLATAAFVVARQLLNDRNDKDRTYLSTDGWPQHGQGRTCSTTAGRR